MTTDIAVPVIAGLVTLAGGGVMGGCVIWIAKKLTGSLISQNAKLTTSIDENTKATRELAELLRSEIKQHDVRDQERLRQMDKIEEAVNKNTEATRIFVERLRGRL